jgi:hypothetical protein
MASRQVLQLTTDRSSAGGDEFPTSVGR